MKYIFALLFIPLSLVCSVGIVLADVPVTFSWDAHPGPNVAGFRLYQSTTSGQYGAPVATIPSGTATSYVMQMKQLPVDTPYYFTLTAFTAGGTESRKSMEVQKVIPAAVIVVVPKPGTPLLSVSNIGETGLTVSWLPVNDGTGALAVMNVRYGLSGIAWGSMPSATCPSSPCRIEGLIPGTPYRLQAVAMRPGAPNVYGDLSAIVATSTLPKSEPVPDEPKGLTVTKATPDEVIITASVIDCPRIGMSRSGSNRFVSMRTVSCQQ